MLSFILGGSVSFQEFSKSIDVEINLFLSKCQVRSDLGYQQERRKSYEAETMSQLLIASVERTVGVRRIIPNSSHFFGTGASERLSSS